MSDSLSQLTAAIRAFSDARDWNQFHTPKNLSMALMVEAAELGEIFQWMSEADSLSLPSDVHKHAAEEIGDILIYLTNLSMRLGIDPVTAAHAKLADANQKYPADEVRGSAKKYSEYRR